MQPQWIHMKERAFYFYVQAVDTFGFEISSFDTVLLAFKMFEMFSDATVWQTWQVNK